NQANPENQGSNCYKWIINKKIELMPEQYKYGEITKKVIGSAMEVHGYLKSGFQELIYQRSLVIEFEQRKIEFAREVEIPIFYKGHQVGMRRVDFLVEEKIPVEIKAVKELEDVHLAQGMNYLEAFNMEVGLLINFGARSLQFKRLHNKKYKPNL
ncbi:MAG: GxxExxY protein, partial [Arenicella sp.]